MGEDLLRTGPRGRQTTTMPPLVSESYHDSTPDWKLAYDLARSVWYQTWRDVADALSRRGMSNAPGLLDNPLIRKHLDRLCEAARSGEMIQGGHGNSP